MMLIRTAIFSLAPILAECFNCCMMEGTYPTAMKLSKISPLYKGKGGRENVDSYRPVAIIPAVAKVFENGISDRLTVFLASTAALSDRQYAYRKGSSTTSLTRDVISRVLQAREKKQQVAILCCDLSRAFDVADRDLLAAKLQHYGVGGAAHALLTDLMLGRSQTVVGCGGMERSDILSTEMGVAQGSSVSNILFSLLLNDLPEAVTEAEIYMYADDVAAVVTAVSLDLLERRLHEVAGQMARWFSMNGLVLNLTKTHFVHFCLSGHRTRQLTVSLDGSNVCQTDVTTFLGFEIDRGLTWENHINKLCGKLGGACFALGRIAKIVPIEVARGCYFATIHSLIQYGAEMFGRAADRGRVFRLQKRAVRAIVGVPQDKSARPLFKKFGILTLPAIVIFQVAVYVRSNLTLYNVLSNETRSKGKLSEVRHTMEKSARSTYVMGPTVYNKLPENVTSAPTMGSFKLRLKQWLIEQSFYSYEEFVQLK